jgi:hypothetical protein
VCTLSLLPTKLKHWIRGAWARLEGDPIYFLSNTRREVNKCTVREKGEIIVTQPRP